MANNLEVRLKVTDEATGVLNKVQSSFGIFSSKSNRFFESGTIASKLYERSIWAQIRGFVGIGAAIGLAKSAMSAYMDEAAKPGASDAMKEQLKSLTLAEEGWNRVLVRIGAYLAPGMAGLAKIAEKAIPKGPEEDMSVDQLRDRRKEESHSLDLLKQKYDLMQRSDYAERGFLINKTKHTEKEQWNIKINIARSKFEMDQTDKLIKGKEALARAERNLGIDTAMGNVAKTKLGVDLDKNKAAEDLRKQREKMFQDKKNDDIKMAEYIAKDEQGKARLEEKWNDEKLHRHEQFIANKERLAEREKELLDASIDVQRQGAIAIGAAMASGVGGGKDGFAESAKNTMLAVISMIEAKALTMVAISSLWDWSALAKIAGIALAFESIKAGLRNSSFASGTSFAPGGMALVGERGPELINLPRGSQVYNNQQTRNMTTNNSPTINFHINGGGNVVDQIKRAIRSRELNLNLLTA
jgi:hypothetical protein